MAASSYSFHSNERNLSHFLSTAVSSKEVILGSDVYQQMYCHLLCGLKECDLVDGVRAPYAAGLIRAFALLEVKWDQLCKDLENGFPSSEITDLAMRESVVRVLSGPQLVLSKRVQSICERKTWDGIISKLWPNARYIKTVTTGSMRQYYSKLKYYAGELPILGADYFASECSVAINMDITQPPELTRYVMLPIGAYFEFLPFDLYKGCASDEDTVDFSGVEVGKMYEVVVTTYRGLFRYRLGDVIKVVGFYNSSPQIEMVMRAPKSSDEIITEKDLLSAMAGFQLGVVTDAMPAEIIEFASFIDVELEPKQLKIFVEVKEGCTLLQKEKSEQLLGDLRRCCSLLEHDLGGIYKVMKARGELGPLLLIVVSPGSFDSLLRVAVENGSPASQYKPPKIIRSRLIAKFLESSAIVNVTA